MYLVGSVRFGWCSQAVSAVHCVQCLLPSKCRTNSVADLKWKASPASDETQDKFILFAIAIVFFAAALFPHFSSLWAYIVHRMLVQLTAALLFVVFFYVHYLCCYICLHFRFHSIFQFYMFTHEVFSLHTHHSPIVCAFGMA